MRRRALTLVVAAGLALTACTGGSEPEGTASGGSSAVADGLPTGDPTSTSRDVAFTPCDSAGFPCAGEVAGFPYEIRLPETWNGTLLIYSHGLRPADALEDDAPAFAPIAEAAPGLVGGASAVADTLLDRGYALLGAGSSEGGWSVTEAREAAVAARETFVRNVGVPDRILTWGQSIGGVAAVQAGQAEPWVDGSASLCGVLGGLNANMDLALDVAFGVRALLLPDLQLTGYDSAAQARAEFRRAIRAVQKAAADPSGLVALQVIAAATETPTRTRTSAGVGEEALGEALVENLGRILARSTVERFGVEQRYGGNPSTNVGVNYGARVTTEEAIEIDSTVGSGATLALLREIAAQDAVEADAAARAEAAAEFPPPGALTRPMVTVHTAEDPLAILPNETVFAAAAAEASGEEIRWLNVNVAEPPAQVPGPDPAPYGVGHCAFTAGTLVGVVDVLDDWVRLGRFPTWAGNAEAFGPNSGFSGPVDLPAWPEGPTTSDS